MLTRRLLNTPMIRSLMAAFAKEIVDDQDVIEAIEADAKAEAEASEVRRGEAEAAAQRERAREAPSTGGSSNASLSSDDHVISSGPYLPRSLRPRGSIYDKTGTLRDMLLAKTPLSMKNGGGRRRSVLGEAHQKTRWTLRLRVQVHEARGLIQAPGVQHLEDRHSGFATVRRGVSFFSSFSFLFSLIKGYVCVGADFSSSCSLPSLYFSYHQQNKQTNKQTNNNNHSPLPCRHSMLPHTSHVQQLSCRAYHFLTLLPPLVLICHSSALPCPQAGATHHGKTPHSKVCT